LWYSDELDIVGFVPDYWNGQGYEACMFGLDAYKKDYDVYDFGSQGFISPEEMESRIIRSEADAVEQLRNAVLNSSEPIYVLVWGNMLTVKEALFTYPEIASGIRMLTIGTGIKYGPKDEVPGDDCTAVNWNGKGRNDIYSDPRFDELWWLESNWTYNGMFQGKGPTEMFGLLQAYGAMGAQIKVVTKRHKWAQYFRVGDTPTVTYMIDTSHDLSNPKSSSWAGKFKRPFPKDRPNYYTDDNGNVAWDYSDPCNTWDNLEAMYAHNKNTLFVKRQEMYDALIEKLDKIYGK
jgi:hypothetical protein